MTTLLDMNVLSELLRERLEPAALAWFAVQAPASLVVGAVTQAEMLLGAGLLPAGRRRRQLQQALEAMFREDFSGRVLPFDTAAAADHADLVHARRNAGRPILQIDAQIDAQIAAITRCRGAAVPVWPPATSPISKAAAWPSTTPGTTGPEATGKPRRSNAPSQAPQVVGRCRAGDGTITTPRKHAWARNGKPSTRI